MADAVITLKNYYRQQPAPILEAERRNIPIYILRSNTVTQMEQCLVDIFHIPVDPVDAFDAAMRETQDGIQRVLNGAEDVVLSPQTAEIRSQQHQLARAANLVSHSYGREPTGVCGSSGSEGTKKVQGGGTFVVDTKTQRDEGYTKKSEEKQRKGHCLKPSCNFVPLCLRV